MMNNTIANNATINNALEAAKATFGKALGFLYKESGCRMLVRRIQATMLVASKSGNLTEATKAVDEAWKSIPEEGLPKFVKGAWAPLKSALHGAFDCIKAAGSKALECCPEFVRIVFSDLGTILSAVIQGLKVVWDAAKHVIRLVGTGALRFAAFCWNSIKKFFSWLKEKGFDLVGGIKSKLHKWSEDDLDDVMDDIEETFEGYEEEAEEFDHSSCFPQG